MCTRTVPAKTEIVLWHRAELAFHLEVARSFAPYLLDCLSEMSRHYADAVDA